MRARPTSHPSPLPNFLDFEQVLETSVQVNVTCHGEQHQGAAQQCIDGCQIPVHGGLYCSHEADDGEEVYQGVPADTNGQRRT